MKAKEYLRTIQKLESETKECYGQAEYLKNSINNLSNQNAIETVEELIVDLMDEASDYAIHRVHLINEYNGAIPGSLEPGTFSACGEVLIAIRREHPAFLRFCP